MNTLHTNEGILYYELKKVDNKRIVYIYSENKTTQEEKDHKLELERKRNKQPKNEIEELKKIQDSYRRKKYKKK